MAELTTIAGLDFTSAPGKKKPILIVIGALNAELGHLTIPDALVTCTSFEALELALPKLGPCVAGFDFPFGLPAEFINVVGWGADWEAVIAKVASLTIHEFSQAIYGFQEAQATGQKEPKRPVDELAKSISPLKLSFVPVGRMFFQGAPRLAKLGWSVLPCRPNASEQIAVEAYPALVARRIIGKQSYKADDNSKQTPIRAEARAAIVNGLFEIARVEYGLRLDLDSALAQRCIADASGDTLDSALAAIQAAWAALNHHKNWGIPETVDPREGWIVDPGLLHQTDASK